MNTRVHRGASIEGPVVAEYPSVCTADYPSRGGTSLHFRLDRVCLVAVPFGRLHPLGLALRPGRTIVHTVTHN